MSVENAIYSRLSGFAGLTALVGTKIFPNYAPKSQSLPYVVYERITSNHIEVLTGSDGLCRATIQIDCYDDSYPDCRSIAEQIRLALQGFSGTVASIVIDGGINLTDDRDLPVDPTDGGDIGTFGIQQDYGVWYVEAVP